MKTTPILLSVIFVTGCATNGGYQAHPKIVFTEESMKRPEYNKDFIECDKIAKSRKTNAGQNTTRGAVAGAGIYALTALLLGADIGALAGVGALHGGVTGAAGSVAYNSNTYKTAFIQCMRDRNYQAY